MIAEENLTTRLEGKDWQIRFMKEDGGCREV